MEAVHILQSFVATGSVLELAKSRRDKDGDKDDDKSGVSRRHHRRVMKSRKRKLRIRNIMTKVEIE